MTHADRARVVSLSLLAAAALGVAARIVLAAISTGSYDVILWRGFAEQIARDGLLATYRNNPHFNHPPIPGLWSAMALWLSDHMPVLSFPFVFKLPMILADAGVCWLLWRIWRTRQASTLSGRTKGPPVAALVAVLFAWNLDALLISAYHCNTDPIYAYLALLAVYLIEARKAHLLGGLALGAAINIKLIPVLLIVPLMLSYRDGRSLLRFVGGLALGAIPFLPVLIWSGAGFARNALGYTSDYGSWGVNSFLIELVRMPRFSGWAQPLLEGFHNLGRFVLLLAVLLAAMVMRRRGNVDRYTSCAVTAALFLIVAPGFAMQYTVYVGPLLFACRAGPGPTWATLYGILSGLGLLFIYLSGWNGRLPIDTTITGGNPAPGPLFWLLAWATLIAFVWRTFSDRGASDVSTKRASPA